MRELTFTRWFLRWPGLLVLVLATDVGRAWAEEPPSLARDPAPATEPVVPAALRRENSIEQRETSLDPELALHMAGTWGDPGKVASNLPGVAHSEPASDGISVWGAQSS